jgi:hypothetical protein
MLGTSTLLIVTTIASALLVGGLLMLALGNLPATVRSQFVLGDRGAAAVRGVFLAALTCFLFVGGLLTEQWGVRQVIVTASLLASFSLASLGINQNQLAMYVFVGLLGAATGLLHTATTVAMPAAFSALGAVPAATNLGYVFVALGSFVVPFFVSFLVNKFSFRTGLLILGLLALVPGSAAAITGTAGDPSSNQSVDLGQLFGEYRFWLMLAGVVSLYGLETSALLWAPKYLEEIGLSPRSRLILWVFFWAIFVAARLASSSLQRFDFLVLCLALASAVLLGNMIGMYRVRPGATSFLCLGGCLGPIFPTLAGVVIVWFPTQPAATFGLICALGTLTRLLVGPITNRLLAAGRVRLTMRMSMILAIVVCLPAVLWLVLPE